MILNTSDTPNPTPKTTKPTTLNKSKKLKPTSRLVLLAIQSSTTALTVANLTEITGSTPAFVARQLPLLIKAGLVQKAYTAVQPEFTLT